MSSRLDSIRTANTVLNHNNPAWREEIEWLIQQVEGRSNQSGAVFNSSEIKERGINPDMNRDSDDHIYCYQCGEVCQEVYQVRVVNRIGKTSYEKVCKIECGEEIQQNLYSLHAGRAESVQDQVFQRLT